MFGYTLGNELSDAEHLCFSLGGHLAEFESTSELNALRLKKGFSELVNEMWIGLKMDSVWKWTNSSMVAASLPWVSGEPTITSEGTPTIIIPSATSWQYRTTNAASKHYPLCEFPYLTKDAVFLTTYKQLDDRDVATCVSSDSLRAAKTLLIKTPRLNPIDERSILVRVQGESILCDPQNQPNIKVMQAGTSQKSGTLYIACEWISNYIWEGKDLCLFMCPCTKARLCDAAYLDVRMKKTMASFSICELSVV